MKALQNINQGWCPHNATVEFKQELFITRSIKVHGDKYDYSNTTFTKAREHLKVRCKEHGEFTVRPDHHIRGSGCPFCNKVGVQGRLTINLVENYCEYYEKINSLLYVLEFNSNDEPTFFKIGVTTKEDINIRAKQYPNKYTIKVVADMEMDLYRAVKGEDTILKDFHNKKYKPKLEFSGHTECLSENPLNYYYYY